MTRAYYEIIENNVFVSRKENYLLRAVEAIDPIDLRKEEAREIKRHFDFICLKEKEPLERNLLVI
eukprot:CAMPEP_0170503880 /NCGR_PEP_ID=MMETSP0208-20121228/46172_1 /TAXON_ID=197538 /ORGANISM="Strombidium inclinatum, Strain S3" /LENGTH=64 /DNA_ID=CAMNT_0010783777 /DNA_START=459 /DNA_END=653 /DNA_ORIENTATION=+